jgi:hypothetical protein
LDLHAQGTQLRFHEFRLQQAVGQLALAQTFLIRECKPDTRDSDVDGLDCSASGSGPSRAEIRHMIRPNTTPATTALAACMSTPRGLRNDSSGKRLACEMISGVTSAQ